MLALVPKHEELVFSMYLSDHRDVLDTLEYGIPRQSRLAQDYFRYILAQDKASEDVEKAWDWLQSHSRADDKLAGEYVDLLLKKGEFSVAAGTSKRSAGRHDHAYPNPHLCFYRSLE